MSLGSQGDRLQTAVIILIALHSFLVGLLLLFATPWVLDFGGWEQVSPLFFARQAGVFHLLLATAYLMEWFRWRGTTFLLLAKSTAVVFLLSMMLVETLPWGVPFSMVADGAMAGVVLFLRRRG